jgi:hypothetical protein
MPRPPIITDAAVNNSPTPEDRVDMLAKSLTFLAGADAAGIVLGARVPIILRSRADSVMTRLASLRRARPENRDSKRRRCRREWRANHKSAFEWLDQTSPRPPRIRVMLAVSWLRRTSLAARN